MPKFTDCKGREWTVAITVADLGRVRTDAKFDLGSALKSSEGFADLLFAEPEKLVTILWVLVESEAKGRNVSPEEFAAGFDGPTVEAGAEALAEAVLDFFPRQQVSRAMRRGLKARLERMDKMILAKMEATEKEADTKSG